MTQLSHKLLEPHKMIRGLIFDFDGLILDTEGPVHQAWVELYQEFGAELPFELWAGLIGSSTQQQFDPFDMLEQKAGHPLDRDGIDKRLYDRIIELTYQQPILPGVEETLKNATDLGLKLSVASSSSRSWVAGHLTRLGLIDFFQVIHTSDDVESTKPDPALFLLALNSMALKADEAIVFEDSPNGVTAAKKVGIFTVAVPNPLTCSLPLGHADLRLDSLADQPLEEIIQKAISPKKER